MTGDDGDFGPLLFLPDEKTEKKLNKIQLAIEIKKKELDSKIQELESFYNYADKLSNFESVVIPKKNIIEKVSFEKISKQRVVSDDKTIIVQGSFGRETDYVIDNSRDITSYSNQKIQKGIAGMHWSLMGVTKYLLKKYQILNGLILFLRPFGLKQQKEKRFYPKSAYYHRRKELLVERMGFNLG